MHTETPEIDDETLMAFVDGELEGQQAQDIARRLEHDAALRERALEFERTTLWLREATEPRLHEPPDAALVARLLGETDSPATHDAATPRPRRRLPMLAMAASLLFGVGVGALLVTRYAATPPAAAARAGLTTLETRAGWREGLESVPSGETFELVAGANVASDRIRALYSFIDVDEHACRVFEREPGPAGAGDTVQGLACRDEAGNWRVRLVASVDVLPTASATGAAPASGYAPAAGPTAAGLEGLIAARMGSAPLSPALERRLLGNGWKLPGER